METALLDHRLDHGWSDERPAPQGAGRSMSVRRCGSVAAARELLAERLERLVGGQRTGVLLGLDVAA